MKSTPLETASGESRMGKAEATIIWKGPRNRGSALLSAISPDDPDDFDAELVGDEDVVELRIRVSADGLSQSRVTIDDILACLVAAESGLDMVG